MKGILVAVLLAQSLAILPVNARELRVSLVSDSTVDNTADELEGWTMEPTISSSNVGRHTSRKESIWVCRDVQSGGIIPGAYFTFTPALGDHNGGHEHTSDRSFGTFEPSSGFSSQSTGRFVTTYEAPEPAGQILAIVTCRDPFGSSGYNTFRIVVAFQDAGGAFFSPLPASDYYTLVGETPTHPINHFGTSVFVTQLQNIAARYHEALPQATLLAYNDMSLPWGGVFDLGSAWLPPHRTHLKGGNVDLRLVPAANRPNLRQIIQAQGLQIYPESDHWHLY